MINLLRHHAWVVTLLLSTGVQAQICPGDVPAGLSAVPIGQDIVNNGLSATIIQVQGRESVERILAQTEKRWREAGLDVRRNSAVGWQILAALGDNCLTTLQLSERNGAFGYFSHSKPAKARLVARDFGVTLPEGAKLESSVASDDDGRKGLTLTLNSNQSLEQLRRFFQEQLSEAKWAGVRTHRMVLPKNAADGQIISAQRERVRIEIVMWKEKQTRMVLTLAPAL
jgi:hypothetical protein